MGTRTLEAERAPAVAEATLRRADEVAIAFFGSWMLLGLLLDGWAHGADKPENFFTPWHGVLYSGFAAMQFFFAQDAWRRRRSSTPLPVARDRLLVGGFAVFLLGGFGDFLWHEVFGIEVSLEALLSPTHLLLLIGGLFMLTAPVRSAWMRTEERSQSLRAFAPALVCLTLATTVVSFFLMYLSAFGEIAAMGVADRYVAGDAIDFAQITGIASILVTNAILMGAMLLTLRRWVVPFGSFAFLFGAVALSVTAVDGFTWVALVVSAAAAGLFADFMARRLRISADRLRGVRILSVAVPLVLWVAWFGTFQVVWGVGWAAELWTGSILLAVLTGLGLSLLAFPSTLNARLFRNVAEVGAVVKAEG